ncbi:hypothetical protein ACO2Q0_15885 [Phenylobacterium sp. VNQ135]
MTHGLQQQDTLVGFCIPKSAASPQHGQKPPEKPVKSREPRSFTPRPGR